MNSLPQILKHTLKISYELRKFNALTNLDVSNVIQSHSLIMIHF